jgi:hypothetical protein
MDSETADGTHEEGEKYCRTSKDFMAMVRRRSMVILDNNVTMDDSTILLHTPEPNSSPAVVSKDQVGQVKAKVPRPGPSKWFWPSLIAKA